MRMTLLNMDLFNEIEVKCGDINSLIADYVDSELPEELHQKMQDHINSCEECYLFDKTYRLVISTAKELAEPSVMPEDAKSRLHKSLNEKLGLNLPE